jgi:hypothetical protein
MKMTLLYNVTQLTSHNKDSMNMLQQLYHYNGSTFTRGQGLRNKIKYTNLWEL